jgi:hypothetical protein
VTKVSSHRDYPLFTVGRIALARNPEKLFRGFSRIEGAVGEQAALRQLVGGPTDARHGVCAIEGRSRARTSSCSTSKRDQTEALADDLCIKYGSYPGFSIRLAVSDVLVNSTYRRVKIQLKLLSNESPSDATQSPMLEILRRDQPDRRVCAGFSAAEGHRRIAL